VNIPTEDSDAWVWYPRERWVYDKLAVALSQGLSAGPHGVPPPHFPVFSKPIINLKGMGVASRVIRSPEEYEQSLAPGHMWMTLLEGRHLSTDVAVVAGEPRWWRHVTGVPGPGGTFDFWAVHAESDAATEGHCGAWIRRHLSRYTGIVNIESIGAGIIEVHLRMSDQWPDLYGAGWVDAVVRLYAKGEWAFADSDRRDGFSVVLFGPHRVRYRHPPSSLLAEIKAIPEVTSVQVTFHEDKDPDRHAMPPGGFRLAVINAWSREAGYAGRELLRKYWRTANSE
jgi:hypothetical protein